MRGKRKLGVFLIALGFALILAAGGLLWYNQAQSLHAETASARVLAQLAAQIAVHHDEPVGQTPALEPLPEPTLQDTASPAQTDLSDPVTRVDGVDYIGAISFPSLSLELPVMAQWSYEGLRTAPGRYSGSAAGENLVVAGHNYASQLGALNKLSLDDPVLFTDVNGKVYQYAVLDIEILQPSDISNMTAGEYPLTVFTCTYGGRTRLTIRCG